MGVARVRNQNDDGWIVIGGGVEVVQQDSEPAETYPGMLWLDTDAESPIWTFGDQIATTSGTSVELITTIPAGIITVEVLFSLVSTNTSAQPPIIQLGDSSGYKTSGYETRITYDTTHVAYSDGFYTNMTDKFGASDNETGVLRLVRWDASEHLWLVDGWSLSAVENAERRILGYVTLTGDLLKIRFTTPGGSATFDNGEARVRYQ